MYNTEQSNDDKRISDAPVSGKCSPDSPVSRQGDRNSTGFSRTRKVVLYIVDHLICGLLIGPLTVLAWRGAWKLLDIYLLHDNPAGSGFTCFAIGNVGLMILVVLQDELKKRISGKIWWQWLLGYHLFTCFCFCCNVCHWRGLWVILDHYTGINENSTWTCLAIGQGLLMMFRCTKNAQAPPMVVAMDYDPEFFAYTTRFRIKRGLSEAYLLDVFCSVFVIHQLVVFYWRGAWNLLEVYLLPNNLSMSAIYSLVIAYSLLALVCIMQPILNYLYRKTQRLLWRWLLETCLYLFSNFVNVATWRGLWMILDQHVLTDRPGVSAAVTLVAGVAGLMLMLAANSITVRCVEMDGDPPDELGCFCPSFYLRYIIASYSLGTSSPTSEAGLSTSANNWNSNVSSDRQEKLFGLDRNIELDGKKERLNGIGNDCFEDKDYQEKNNIRERSFRKTNSASHGNVSETSVDITEGIGIQSYM